MKKVLFTFLFTLNCFQAQSVDTDNDGVLDIDDYCPTIAGIKENYGCPETIRKNCAYFNKKDQETFEQFKIDNQNIENIYNIINRNILDDISKKQLNNSFIYIHFINNYSPCDVAGRCCSELYLSKYNFLIIKFWNKDAIENIFKKYKSSVILSSSVNEQIIKEYEAEFSPKLLSYLMKYYDENNGRGRIYLKSKNVGKEKNHIQIRIEFRNPYQIEISYLDKIKKYEYNNQKWEIINSK